MVGKPMYAGFITIGAGDMFNVRLLRRCLDWYLRNQRGGAGDSDDVADGDSSVEDGDGLRRLVRFFFLCLFLVGAGVDTTGSGLWMWARRDSTASVATWAAR